MTVSQVNTFTVFVHKARATRPGRLGSRRASAGSGRPRRGSAAAARRRRPACGLRSRSTCRRARCSTTRDIWGCSGGSDRLHAHHLCAGRRCGATARRADACAAKQRAARVDEQPCVSTKLLHVVFSGFVMRHARACAARLACARRPGPRAAMARPAAVRVRRLLPPQGARDGSNPADARACTRADSTLIACARTGLRRDRPWSAAAMAPPPPHRPPTSRRCRRRGRRPPPTLPTAPQPSPSMVRATARTYHVLTARTC